MGKPRDFSLTFTGAGEREIHATGKYVRVLDTPVADVFFSLDSGGELQRGAGQQIADSDPQGFTRIRVRTAVAQTVRFTVADVPQDDSRSNVALSVDATVASSTAATALPSVTVPALGSAQLCGANADRQEVRLSVPSNQAGDAEGVWFSDDPGITADEGGWLERGMTDYPATKSALWAFNPHATDDLVVSLLDMETP